VHKTIFFKETAVIHFVCCYILLGQMISSGILLNYLHWSKMTQSQLPWLCAVIGKIIIRINLNQIAREKLENLSAFWNKNAQAVLTSIVCEQQLILCCQSGLMTVIYMSLFRLSFQLQKFHHSQLWEKSELWDEEYKLGEFLRKRQAFI